jgi:hypothetical protein
MVPSRLSPAGDAKPVVFPPLYSPPDTLDPIGKGWEHTKNRSGGKAKYVGFLPLVARGSKEAADRQFTRLNLG